MAAHNTNLGFVAVTALGVLATLPARAAEWDKPGYTLTFQDEFDATALDTSKWQRRFKWGEAVINDELQAYTDDQFAIASGILSIVGEHKPATYAGMSLDYASGLIASVHHQTYGYFEARLKMPSGQGLWPAFWLLGENGTQGVNEIDIHELLGNDPTTVYMTVHWGQSYSVGHESDGVSYTGPDFSTDFHVFGLDWEPDAIHWYIDGVERHSHTGAGVPSVEMYMIANLAIGGGWPGSPDGSTMFPANYQIDYVRAYQKDGATGGTGGAAGSSGAGGSGGVAGTTTTGGSGGTPGPSGGGGVMTMAGSSSAGGPASAGAAAMSTSNDAGGCGCRSARGSTSSPLLFALFAFGVRRRCVRRSRA